MIETTGKKLKPATVVVFILLNVPKIDCNTLNYLNLTKKNLKVDNNAYQIRTKRGIFKTWFAGCYLQISDIQTFEDIREK